MRYRVKAITDKTYRVAPLTIRRILTKAGVRVGRYCASSRVSGWGNFYGKVEVTEKELVFEFVSRTQFREFYRKIVCVKIDFWNDGESERAKVLEALKDFKVTTEGKSLIVDKIGE